MNTKIPRSTKTLVAGVRQRCTDVSHRCHFCIVVLNCGEYCNLICRHVSVAVLQHRRPHHHFDRRDQLEGAVSAQQTRFRRYFHRRFCVISDFRQSPSGEDGNDDYATLLKELEVPLVDFIRFLA